MKTIKIKNNTLGDAPKTVGIIDELIPEHELKKFAEHGVDIFEIRADLINVPLADVADYAQRIRNALACPFIGTVRETDNTRGNIDEWYSAVMNFVDIIDIDLDMPAHKIIAENIAKTFAVLMVSVHDFDKTPSMHELCDIAARAKEQGAQIIKIATLAKSADDVTRLMNFAASCDTPVVAMSMGQYANISRVIAPLYGSLFSYGYLRKPIVPGQPSALELAQAFRKFYHANKNVYGKCLNII